MSDTHESRDTYTKEELLEYIESLADDLGHSPSAQEMNMADEYPSVTTYYRFFDSWNAAKKEIDLTTLRKNNKYNQDELIEKLRSLADKIGHSPSAPEMDDADGYPSTRTYLLNFESWNAAKKEAGLDIHQRGEYTQKELIRYLRSLKNKPGHVPTATEMNESEDFPSSGAYCSQFGSWNNALKKADLLSTT